MRRTEASSSLGASSDPTPVKRLNNEGWSSAETVEGRASPKGNGGQTAAARTLRRDTASNGLAAVRRTANGLNPFATDVRPEGGARCVSSARRDLCGGRSEMAVPYRDHEPRFRMCAHAAEFSRSEL